MLDGGLVGPGGARWWLGAGAANWCDKNNVDAGARKVFMSLSLKEQDVIRSLGGVGSRENPSRDLMGRVRKIAGRGYVPETTSYARCVVPQEAPEIVVCVRGQAFRIGGRGEH